MIKHVYLYKLKERSKAAEAAEKLLTMQDNIPSVAKVEVGIDFIGAAASYDLMEMVECRNEENFKDFCVHPYHDVIRAYMKTVVAEGWKVDYSC